MEPAPGQQPDPVGDALRLRASDADREKVAGILREAFAEGRLSPVEHDERLSEVYRATTYGDLLPLLADLPVPPGAFTVPGGAQVVAVSPGTDVSRRDDERVAIIDTTRGDQGISTSFAFMSETKRRGRWVLPPTSSALAVMGNVELDLTEAVLTSLSTEITTSAVMGTIKITVPAGVIVESSVVAVMGATSVPPDDPAPGAPVVRISGFAFMGEIKVERSVRRIIG